MASYPLRRCGLRDRTIFMLESRRIKNASDLLRHTPLDLVQLLDVPLGKAKVSFGFIFVWGVRVGGI